MPDAAAGKVPTVTVELMLLRWSESSAGGASITFALADPADLEPFKAMTLAKGGKAGQRLMGALALVGDDERPEPLPARPPGRRAAGAVLVPSAPPAPPVPKGGPLSRLAGRWCASELFQRWIRPLYDLHLDGDGDGSGWGELGAEAMAPDAFARHAILVLCEVDSRRELDHDQAAAQRFHELVRVPFAEYMAAQQA